MESLSDEERCGYTKTVTVLQYRMAQSKWFTFESIWSSVPPVNTIPALSRHTIWNAGWQWNSAEWLDGPGWTIHAHNSKNEITIWIAPKHTINQSSGDFDCLSNGLSNGLSSGLSEGLSKSIKHYLTLSQLQQRKIIQSKSVVCDFHPIRSHLICLHLIGSCSLPFYLLCSGCTLLVLSFFTLFFRAARNSSGPYPNGHT